LALRSRPACDLKPAWRGAHYYNDAVFLCDQCLAEASRPSENKPDEPGERHPFGGNSRGVEPADPAGGELAEILPRGNGERVLLIDDEPSVNIVASMILRRLGYSVIPFTDPVEALTAFERSPRLYDVVLTDFSMPHLTGTEIAHRIRLIRPELPIILCTGYRGRIDDAELKRLGIRLALDKPYRRMTLARALREALGE
jgi:CheY-like chemotaxis protein